MFILLMMSLTAVLALVDIVIKFYVEGHIAKGETHKVPGDKVEIRKVYNEGFAMNLMDERPDDVRVVSAYTTMLLTICQCLTLLQKRGFFRKIGLSLMTAGAWSNTFDRWVHRYVIDYIGFRSKSEKLNRLTFNLGDFCIGIGGTLVLLTMFFTKKSNKK